MKKFLGRQLWVGVVLMFCGPLAAVAADLNVQSNTLLRGFERDTASAMN